MVGKSWTGNCKYCRRNSQNIDFLGRSGVDCLSDLIDMKCIDYSTICFYILV